MMHDMAPHDALTLPGANVQRVREARFVVLPLGSVEYHGPHAPLGVDTTLAVGFARALAERADGLVLPPIAYTFASTLTSARPGTLSVAAEPFLAYVREVLAALVRQGVTRVVALNAHSENQHALRLAAETVVAGAPAASVLIVDWWKLVRPEDAPAFSEAGGHGHGGPVEVSTTAAFDPAGVLRSAAPDIAYEAPWWRGAAQVVGAGQAPRGFDGYHGRVSEIDAAVGAAIRDAVLQRLERLVDEWLERAAG
ncbi:MAG: creatininase family protein [Trueperaceae bacterium]|nr:MAG: creatininase family protein [Trueperaceae bacterium]